MDNYQFCAEFAANLVDSGRVLDFGCGKGQTVELLMAWGVDAYGCDVFYEGGNRKKLVSRALLDQKRVREMSGDTIPFDDGYFDVVVHSTVFEHLPDLDASVAEIARVLKPGGTMLGIFPDKACWREGHCGVPFLHWFPKQSTPRTYYALAFHVLGFGYHRAGKTRTQWVRDSCEYMDRWCHYRSYSAIADTLARQFGPLQHIEHHWFDSRVGKASAYVPNSAKRAIVRKFAGLVFWCKKRP